MKSEKWGRKQILHSALFFLHFFFRIFPLKKNEISLLDWLIFREITVNLQAEEVKHYEREFCHTTV